MSAGFDPATDHVLRLPQSSLSFVLASRERFCPLAFRGSLLCPLRACLSSSYASCHMASWSLWFPSLSRYFVPVPTGRALRRVRPIGPLRPFVLLPPAGSVAGTVVRGRNGLGAARTVSRPHTPTIAGLRAAGMPVPRVSFSWREVPPNLRRLRRSLPLSDPAIEAPAAPRPALHPAVRSQYPRQCSITD